MNVIVSNKYQVMLENLGIDIIKNLNDFYVAPKRNVFLIAIDEAS